MLVSSACRHFRPAGCRSSSLCVRRREVVKVAISVAKSGAMVKCACRAVGFIDLEIELCRTMLLRPSGDRRKDAPAMTAPAMQLCGAHHIDACPFTADDTGAASDRFVTD